MSVPRADPVAFWRKAVLNMRDGIAPQVPVEDLRVMLGLAPPPVVVPPPVADDLDESDNEPLRLPDVDAEELSAIVDDLKMLYREAQEEGLA